jgi:hypothetical protein
MVPIFDPAGAMFEPVVWGVLALAAVAVAGMVAVVALVARADRRPPRRRGRVLPIRLRVPEAA